MAKYSVMYQLYASGFCEVEAENEEQAKELAMENADAGLCWQCSKHIQIDDIGDVLEVSKLS